MKLSRGIRLFFALFILWGARDVTAQDWVYHAQEGDTLWDLCLKYTAKRGCWVELAKYNGLSSDQVVLPDEEIRIPLAWLLERPIVGTVLRVQGEVHYQKQLGSNRIPLVRGQYLVLGSIIASSGGSAKLALGNHSKVFLRPNSVLELHTMSVGERPGQTTELVLDRGNVEVQVKPESRSRFEIRTPSAIAAVRGTKYRVTSDSVTDATRSEVLTGLVAMQASSAVDVPAGFGLIAKKGAPLGAPRKLLSAPDFTCGRVQASLPFKVQWVNDPGAVSWNLDLYTQGDVGELLLRSRPTQAEFIYDDLPLGCYLLVARAIDTDGFNGLESELDVCIQEPVLDPVDLCVQEPAQAESHWDLMLWGVLASLLLL